ncbi:DUF3027 domain-containing protein [Microbacterium aquimaris]|uniref:DUF3027 domain-containing protein n=1 Tax=Microbacterium aquimaris TaxID=459816 RepID=UPI002AD30468|nr:DUF3027 domain-containing protein [Microbacterium aquimaris]MDZ8277006.1 DUF3027 domain-containing protein [Microbacterium aquimaris]
MTSTPDAPGPDQPAADAVALPDPALLAAHDLALAALREITPESTIGAPAGHRVETDGIVSLLFANRLAGYPGWFWTVSLARVADADPTVLEVELLPGDDALLAPDWVPWAERLADYQAAQAAAAEDAASGDGSDEDDSDADEPDEDDEDDRGSILHSGDVDGVDIDELSPDYTEEDDAEDDGTDLDDSEVDADAADDADAPGSDEDPEPVDTTDEQD